MARLLDSVDLPDGYVPVEIVAVVKCLDDKGDPTIAVRSSEGITAWEAIGMLTAASDMARADLQSELLTTWEDQDEEYIDTDGDSQDQD